MYDVLVVGELNVDLILDGIEKFPEVGKEVLARKMTLTLGSSSAIFASNISSLGASVAFIGKIGNDKFGEVVLQSLQEKNVDVSMIGVEELLSTGVTIVLNADEDRANTTYPGAMSHLTLDDIADSDLCKAKHLHFSSYFLQSGMWGHLGELFRRAKRFGLTTSFDMQWDPDETWQLDMFDVLPHVDIFLPNEDELMRLTDRETTEEAIGVAKEYANILVVKRGRKGSYVYSNGKLTDLPSFLNSQVVDAVGAGDSFNAGFILQFIKGSDLEECQKIGNLAGAISTTAEGGTKAFENYEGFKTTAKEFFGVDI